MRKPNELSGAKAPDKLLSSPSRSWSRRSLLKGSVAGATGLITASAGSGLLSLAHASSLAGSPDSVKTILSVARTAEQLAVTFYSQAIAHADSLGLKGKNLEDVRAILIGEQIHQHFFASMGGESLADTFSFPEGAATYENFGLFIKTLLQLEGVFDTTYLAAVKEFAQLGQPRMAQIAAQTAWTEGEHRVIGRKIAGLSPADNWGFAPVLVRKVSDAPKAVKDAGYLSPRSGNSYKYHPVSTADHGIIYRTPFAL
jgi:rubrerythrin